eukprot:CAMPEP_0116894364 /NCGR_PEP_ID=MMETSP0467-20121206/4146_1 /TAXON_ID=283647 /ORGANISM="Mesodinium pulex, Strain SPMC105" /LENGTH=76 /DNA_ID=CAMNT_0004564537 /DNA_START=354 /DNA_END=584 /DNA_ORIENTATION=-
MKLANAANVFISEYIRSKTNNIIINEQDTKKNANSIENKNDGNGNGNAALEVSEEAYVLHFSPILKDIAEKFVFVD